MKDMDASYKVLGLTPDASEADIRLAHKDLLDRLYPDLLSPKSSLRNSAKEKIAEANEAFDKLMLHVAEMAPKAPISQPAERYTQGQAEQFLKSDALPENSGDAEAPTVTSIKPGYIPPAIAVLVSLLYVNLFGLSSAGGTLIAMIFASAGWLAGHALVRAVNRLDAPRLHRIAVAWMTTVFMSVVVISLPVLTKKSAKGVVSDNSESATLKTPHGARSQKSEPGNEGGTSAREMGNLSGKATGTVESTSWLDKGKELILAGKYAEAIEALTRSIEMNPENASAYNSRGVAYAYSHLYGKAMDDYNKAIELDPGGDGSYYLNRGIVYVAKGNYQQAITDYKKAAGLGNKEARDFFNSQNIVW